jgi:hypothetical protein
VHSTYQPLESMAVFLLPPHTRSVAAESRAHSEQSYGSFEGRPIIFESQIKVVSRGPELGRVSGIWKVESSYPSQPVRYLVFSR